MEQEPLTVLCQSRGQEPLGACGTLVELVGTSELWLGREGVRNIVEAEGTAHAKVLRQEGRRYFL